MAESTFHHGGASLPPLPPPPALDESLQSPALPPPPADSTLPPPLPPPADYDDAEPDSVLSNNSNIEELVTPLRAIIAEVRAPDHLQSLTFVIKVQELASDLGLVMGQARDDSLPSTHDPDGFSQHKSKMWDEAKALVTATRQLVIGTAKSEVLSTEIES